MGAFRAVLHLSLIHIFGGGGVLIIYLTLFLGMEQGIAQGVNLIFFIPSAVIALIVYSRKKMIAWKAAIPAAVLGVAGAWLGTYLSSLIDGYWLSKLFGGLLLIMGVMQLFYKKEKGGDSAGSKKDVYKRQCLGFNWEDMTSWQAVGNVLLQAVQSPVIVVSVLVSVWNLLNDPTTSGLSDSSQALSYTCLLYTSRCV